MGVRLRSGSPPTIAPIVRSIAVALVAIGISRIRVRRRAEQSVVPTLIAPPPSKPTAFSFGFDRRLGTFQPAVDNGPMEEALRFSGRRDPESPA